MLGYLLRFLSRLKWLQKNRLFLLLCTNCPKNCCYIRLVIFPPLPCSQLLRSVWVCVSVFFFISCLFLSVNRLIMKLVWSFLASICFFMLNNKIFSQQNGLSLYFVASLLFNSNKKLIFFSFSRRSVENTKNTLSDPMCCMYDCHT